MRKPQKEAFSSLAAIILSAGLGTRMKSELPKVLHKIFGKPMINYVVESIIPLKTQKNIVVINPKSKSIKNALKDYKVSFVIQKEPRGTADAVKAAIKNLNPFNGTVLILNGDTPLIGTDILKKLLSLHRQNHEDISIISFIAKDPSSYGRIVRKDDEVVSIIEDRDASEEQKSIKEVNSGIYAIDTNALRLLKEIKINKSKGEYYLTDIVDIAVKKGLKVRAHIIGGEEELTGINTRRDLLNATHYLREKILSKWIDNGVSFIDKSSVFIHPDAKIGMDTIIYPNVHIEGKTIIGKGCTIYPNTRIIDSNIGNNVIIKDNTVIESSTVKDSAAIGPFAHIRPDSLIGNKSKIGNFVEIKKSIIGDNTKASHLSYLGDAEIGNNVNIGAGTITCNYDGRRKNKTTIEDNAFIGSDTQLIAPVKIGKGSYIGAGSTITKDVPPDSLALTRTEQKNIEKWAIKMRKSETKKKER